LLPHYSDGFFRRKLAHSICDRATRAEEKKRNGVRKFNQQREVLKVDLMGLIRKEKRRGKLSSVSALASRWLHGAKKGGKN